VESHCRQEVSLQAVIPAKAGIHLFFRRRTPSRSKFVTSIRLGFANLSAGMRRLYS
jgi:hypothetical protein